MVWRLGRKVVLRDLKLSELIIFPGPCRLCGNLVRKLDVPPLKKSLGVIYFLLNRSAKNTPVKSAGTVQLEFPELTQGAEHEWKYVWDSHFCSSLE